MEIFLIFVLPVLFFIAGFWLARLSKDFDLPSCTIDQIKPAQKTESAQKDKWKIDMDKLNVWGIVRYVNGKYDCVWHSGYSKREAEKRCKELNSDYHRYYGTYVVENMTYSNEN